MPQSSCSLFSSKLLYTREETNTSSSSILSNNSYQWYFLLFDVSSVTVRTELPKFDMHWLYSQPIKIGICIVVVCSVKVMDKSQAPYLSSLDHDYLPLWSISYAVIHPDKHCTLSEATLDEV